MSHNVNEIQISYKRPVTFGEMPKITGSDDAYSLLYSLWDENRLDLVEEFKVLLLNRANRVIGVHHVSCGGTASTVADPKMIFIAAIKTNASSLILAHNHPSGNLKPSEQDKVMTKRLVSAGQLLEINVFDHIILTREGYHSFTDGLTYQKVERPSGCYLEAIQPF